MTLAHANRIPSFGGLINKIWGRTEAQPQRIEHMQNITNLNVPQESMKIAEGFTTLSATDAAAIIKRNGYAGNRKLSKPHVSKLAEYMRRGQWLAKSGIDFARFPDGRLVLVNGHHRMAAQSETTSSILWSINFHDVQDDAELRALYYRFDTEVRKRSAANIVAGVGLAEDLGLSKQMATALWGATSLIANGMAFLRYTQGKADVLADEKMQLCSEYAEAARTYGEYVDLAPAFLRAKLRTVSVMGLALVTIRYQPEISAPFWQGLCEDDGLSKGDPRKAFLLDMQARRIAGGLLAAPLMSGAKAWNAHYAGRDLKHLKVTGQSVRISGTPYTVTA